MVKGYNAVHLDEEGLLRLRDLEILEKARQEERIILTFDLDFGELLAVSRASVPSVIIFRLATTASDLETITEMGDTGLEPVTPSV